jgi:hypothetical protein
MFVKELQQRINNISADIICLENNRHAVQRQLNSASDPIARLPLEISSEIFIECLGIPLPSSGAHRAPMLLMNICWNWTDIVLATPALWAAIDAEDPIFDLPNLLDIWLKRARNRALSIRLPADVY